ncbi:MAG: nucleotidyl transferase AbiEii/AbiGii toxin family protein, partial [Anaerolineae bacterium]
MKEYLFSLIQSAANPLEARNVAREYLQALILQSLQRAGAMTTLAFHGGTALRFLYSIPRFSEDLDFALEANFPAYDLLRYLQSLRKDLEMQGYAVAIAANDKRTVHSAFVRFPGLLFELGLSPHKDEMLAVKLEIDTKPPAGAVLTTSLVRRHVLLNLQHHDRASLLAGKLHAVLQRPYLKGRDLYDLMWYLSDKAWPAPNLNLLNHALIQTGWRNGTVNDQNWRDAARTRIESAAWKAALEDVRPFIASADELNL